MVENGTTLQSGTETVPKWGPSCEQENGYTLELFRLHFFLSVYTGAKTTVGGTESNEFQTHLIFCHLMRKIMGPNKQLQRLYFEIYYIIYFVTFVLIKDYNMILI